MFVGGGIQGRFVASCISLHEAVVPHRTRERTMRRCLRPLLALPHASISHSVAHDGRCRRRPLDVCGWGVDMYMCIGMYSHR